MKLILDQKLKFEFSNLDIKGSNIDNFYSYCFNLFLFDNSELSKAQKVEAIITGQLDGKSEITIQKVLAERTFIQDQLVRHERNLKEIIHPDNREKLNIWVNYLKQKEKAIIDILPKIPEWTQPLIALYCVYKDIQLNEKNREEIAGQLKTKSSPEAVKLYNEYQKEQNRIFTNFHEDDRRKADEMLKRLKNLKLIMESWDGKGSEKLLADIQALETNLGYISKK